MREAVIVSTARTPIGRAYRGAFNTTPAPTLGGHAIAHAVATAHDYAHAYAIALAPAPGLAPSPLSLLTPVPMPLPLPVLFAEPDSIPPLDYIIKTGLMVSAWLTIW